MASDPSLVPVCKSDPPTPRAALAAAAEEALAAEARAMIAEARAMIAEARAMVAEAKAVPVNVAAAVEKMATAVRKVEAAAEKAAAVAAKATAVAAKAPAVAAKAPAVAERVSPRATRSATSAAQGRTPRTTPALKLKLKQAAPSTVRITRLATKTTAAVAESSGMGAVTAARVDVPSNTGREWTTDELRRWCEAVMSGECWKDVSIHVGGGRKPDACRGIMRRKQAEILSVMTDVFPIATKTQRDLVKAALASCKDEKKGVKVKAKVKVKEEEVQGEEVLGEKVLGEKVPGEEFTGLENPEEDRIWEEFKQEIREMDLGQIAGLFIPTAPEVPDKVSDLLDGSPSP